MMSFAVFEHFLGHFFSGERKILRWTLRILSRYLKLTIVMLCMFKTKENLETKMMTRPKTTLKKLKSFRSKVKVGQSSSLSGVLDCELKYQFCPV